MTEGISSRFMTVFNRHVGRIVMILTSTAIFQLLRLQIATTSETVMYMRTTETQTKQHIFTNNEEKRFCTRDEIREGAWKKVLLKAPPYVPTDKRSICYRADVFEKPTFTSWDWLPTNSEKDAGGCRFSPWDSDAFCRVANGIRTSSVPTLAIVGDSLSFEQYSSLVQLLGLPSQEDDQVTARTQNIIQAACNWTMVYRQSDSLEILPSVVEANDPNVIVISRGANYVNDEQFVSELESTIQFLQSWQKGCSAQGKTCWLFVRTSVPGHPKCGDYKEPSSSKQAMEALVANQSNYAEEKQRIFYQWNMKHQNELVLDLFSKSGLQYQVIDAYELNILRPDLHRLPDCLRNCYPGKMDVYNQLLLHFLQQNLIETQSYSAGQAQVPTHDSSSTPSLKETTNSEPQVMNCGCPSICNDTALGQRRKKYPFSCKERILYMMSRYQMTEAAACAHASNPEYGACGPECDPKLCGANPPS